MDEGGDERLLAETMNKALLYLFPRFGHLAESMRTNMTMGSAENLQNTAGFSAAALQRIFTLGIAKNAMFFEMLEENVVATSVTSNNR